MHELETPTFLGWLVSFVWGHESAKHKIEIILGELFINNDRAPDGTTAQEVCKMDYLDKFCFLRKLNDCPAMLGHPLQGKIKAFVEEMQSDKSNLVSLVED